MKLEKFKETNKKKTGMMIFICFVVLLCTVIVVFRSFALYEEKKEFDVIKGRVPDQNYDVLFAFTLEDKEGNKTNIENVPEGKNYEVTVSCDKGATGEWNYEEWGPLIKNLTNARTKCKINFGPSKAIADVIKNLPIVTEGSGLYEVSHSDAEITYTTDSNAINNLKQTELRYAGANPNNYVNFNNELWRIVGLVNTPEGQRVKLIRHENIGSRSWDLSDTSINSGQGVNEWSQSDLKNYLNNDYYNSLKNESKNMIDSVTWSTSAIHRDNYSKYTVKNFYDGEKSNRIGKICNNGSDCSDGVSRTTSWKGKVGLISVNDFGYASSGGNIADRNACLNKAYISSYGGYGECPMTNWFNRTNDYWTITPLADNKYAYYVLFIYGKVGGGLGYTSAAQSRIVYPVVYLKQEVKIESGIGSLNDPLNIILED